MRAVAADDVEQHARRAAVAGRRLEQLQARCRGRPSGAGGPACSARSPRSRTTWPSPVDRPRARCATGAEQRLEHDAAPRGRASRRRTGRGRAPARALHRRRRRRDARRRAGGGERRGLERRMHLPAVERRPPSPRAPRRRACPPGTASASASSASGSLATSSSVSVCSSSRQHREALAHHRAADRGRQVAPADADDVRHAAAGGVEQAGDLLRAGARPRRRCPRGPRRTTLAKPSPTPAEHRGAALGSHHQQAALGAAALERDLVLERHVVGEEEDVQAARQRAVGLERRVLAGHRDERDVGARRSRRPACAAGAGPGLARARRRPRPAAAATSARTASPRPSSPSTATTTSPGLASALAPSAASALRLAGVPITTSHADTPSRSRSARAMPMSRTLSA